MPPWGAARSVLDAEADETILVTVLVAISVTVAGVAMVFCSASYMVRAELERCARRQVSCIYMVYDIFGAYIYDEDETEEMRPKERRALAKLNNVRCVRMLRIS